MRTDGPGRHAEGTSATNIVLTRKITKAGDANTVPTHKVIEEGIGAEATTGEITSLRLRVDDLTRVAHAKLG